MRGRRRGFQRCSWLVAWLSAGYGVLAAPVTAEDVPTRQPAPGDQGDPLQAARAHFQKGAQYYGEGNFRAALIEFERAYVLQPTYRLLYNLGQVTYELGDYAAAERHFRAYLTDGGDEISAERREEVEQELKTLFSRVASLEVRSNLPGAEVRVDERRVGTTPLNRTLRVSIGRRRLTAELSNYAPVSKLVDVVGGDRLEVELDFGPPLLPTLSTAAGSTGPKKAPNWALVTGVATGVFALGAVTVGVLAASDAAEFDAELDRPTSRHRLDSLSDDTKLKALVTDALIGATVVSGALTLLILLTREHGERAAGPAAASARPRPAVSFDVRRLQLRF